MSTQRADTQLRRVAFDRLQVLRFDHYNNARTLSRSASLGGMWWHQWQHGRKKGRITQANILQLSQSQPSSWERACVCPRLESMYLSAENELAKSLCQPLESRCGVKKPYQECSWNPLCRDLAWQSNKSVHDLVHTKVSWHIPGCLLLPDIPAS
ncbi:hypothetical protein VTO42DRAFT_8537 [Malbranchea cinnamomea]